MPWRGRGTQHGLAFFTEVGVEGAVSLSNETHHSPSLAGLIAMLSFWAYATTFRLRSCNTFFRSGSTAPEPMSTALNQEDGEASYRIDRYGVLKESSSLKKEEDSG